MTITLLIATSLTASLAAILFPLMGNRRLARRAAALMQPRAAIDETTTQQPSVRTPLSKLSDVLPGVFRRFGLTNQQMQRRLRMIGRVRRAGLPQTRVAVFASAKLLMPLAVLPLAWLGIGVAFDIPGPQRLLLAIMLGAGGFWVPDVWLANTIQRRQDRIRRYWPDALDLLQMCMRSGMTLESALAKVSREIRVSSPDIADELLLTVSELNYLNERRKALENLAERTGIAPVREVVTALIQSQRFGAVLADTLQVLARENRALRLIEAEKKAASLPPKLTVPMIIFFLPALFVVIVTPAIINLMRQ